MEYRYLGRSGLKVSTITLGTMTFGGQGPFAMIGDLGVDDARSIIDLCVDHGVNVIDTANMYSAGKSEEIIGEALNGKRPGNMLISTKARLPIGDGPNDGGFSRHHLIGECEKSLKRLRTDVIDIYYMHEWDGQTPLEEMLETLDSLVKQGKIRYIGCSNFSGWHIMKALGVSTQNHLQRFVTQQIHYTLEAREAEYELLPIAVDQGVGVLAWSPLAGGLLSGKYSRNKTPDGVTRLSEGWTEPPIRDEERLWNIVDALNDIAAQHHVSAAQVALAWILSRPGVASVVIGGRKEAQIKDNVAAADLELSDEELQRLNTVSAIPLIYPYWHQASFAKDTFTPADRALFG
ncbi:MAG: aldo/keto reductase [Spirochaeta sp.]|jgi:aryl-alcohol dehydrogenase-like predicted oxidoreductase|nr:aldo/keto reductase [Spirochaeta sp.]